jgi:hypothetical protein
MKCVVDTDVVGCLHVTSMMRSPGRPSPWRPLSSPDAGRRGPRVVSELKAWGAPQVSLHGARLPRTRSRSLTVDCVHSSPSRAGTIPRSTGLPPTELQIARLAAGGLLRRHRLIRDAVLAVTSALIVLVAAMFLIAAAELSQQTPIASLALIGS